MLADDRQVANTQNVVLQQILLFIWKGEQRFALRGGQEFTAGHSTIMIMNWVFGNRDRSNFPDPMTSLVPDDGAGLTHIESLAADNNSAQDSLRFIIQSFKSLAYVNFRFLSYPMQSR